MVMRLATDLRTTIQAILLIEKGIIIEPDFDKVCDWIDPEIHAFCEIYGTDKIGIYQIEPALKGIHMAFWIMLDEKLKFPSDSIAFSTLMQKCFTFMLEPVEEKLEILSKTCNDLNKDQLLWVSNLIQFKSENYSLIYSCLWTLLTLWDHIQKQEEFRSELAEKSKYLF